MERKALEAAGTQYTVLRGLLGIPLGVLFICSGLGNLEWGPFRHLWSFWVVAGAAAGAYFVINRHYRREYGQVTPSRRDQIKVVLIVALGAAAVWGGASLDWNRDLPFNWIAAAFAVNFLVYYALTVGLRRHHVVIWGALLAAGLAPVWSDVSGGTKINVGLMLMGVAILITGVFDHLALREALSPTATALTDEPGL